MLMFPDFERDPWPVPVVCIWGWKAFRILVPFYGFVYFWLIPSLIILEALEISFYWVFLSWFSGPGESEF